GVFVVVLALNQSPDTPRVRRLSVVSKYSTEIVFNYGYRIFVEGEPIKHGVVECFISQLKSTGLFTDVQVEVKALGEGEWAEVDIIPTWDKRRKSFVISEIDFDGFEGFDVDVVKAALQTEGLHPGISLWKFSLLEIGNMIHEQASRVYSADEAMLSRIANA